MRSTVLWITGAVVLCVAGWMLYQKRTGRGVHSKATVGPISDKTSIPQPAEAPEQTEQEQLLEKLQSQRAAIVLSAYRIACAKAFDGLSSGIQALLAINCGADALCGKVSIIAANKSILSRIARIKQKAEPAPLSEEEISDDLDMLRSRIRSESFRLTAPALPLPWDTLIEALIPCLKDLIQAAEDNQAQVCRTQLTQLRTILADHDVHPFLYRDDAVQQDEDMQWAFTESNTKPVPALFYRTKEGKYIHIGSQGYTDSTTIEKE